jgi:hypothetical protein
MMLADRLFTPMKRHLPRLSSGAIRALGTAILAPFTSAWTQGIFGALWLVAGLWTSMGSLSRGTRIR